MDKMKNLRAGIEEMRSVAQRLLTWAEDMEKSLASDAPGVAAEAGQAAAMDKKAAVKETVMPEKAAPVAPSRSAVKVLLTKLCAAGYSAQVKALIASFGAASLSAVPEEALGDLWDQAQLLGGEPDAG